MYERADKLEPWLKATIPEVTTHQPVLRMLCKNNGIYVIYMLVCLWKMYGAVKFRSLAFVRNLFDSGHQVFVDKATASQYALEDEAEVSEAEAERKEDDDPFSTRECLRKARYLSDYCLGGPGRRNDKEHVKKVMLKSGFMVLFQLDFLQPGGWCPISFITHLLYRSWVFSELY